MKLKLREEEYGAIKTNIILFNIILSIIFFILKDKPAPVITVLLIYGGKSEEQSVNI